MDFPILAYLTCAQVFEAASEGEHSQQALKAGYYELIGRAKKISDLEWRASFLDNIEEHDQIIDLRRKTQAL